MEIIIETAIQGLGWCVLKAVTLGAYRRTSAHDGLIEVATGLAAIVGTAWGTYSLMS